MNQQILVFLEGLFQTVRHSQLDPLDVYSGYVAYSLDRHRAAFLAPQRNPHVEGGNLPKQNLLQDFIKIA